MTLNEHVSILQQTECPHRTINTLRTSTLRPASPFPSIDASSIDNLIPECLSESIFTDWFDFEPSHATHPALQFISSIHPGTFLFLIHDTDLYCLKSSLSFGNIRQTIENIHKVASRMKDVTGLLPVFVRDVPPAVCHTDPYISTCGRKSLPGSINTIFKKISPQNKCIQPQSYPKYGAYGEKLSTSSYLNDPKHAFDESTAFETNEGECLASATHEVSPVNAFSHYPRLNHSTMLSYTREMYGLGGGLPLLYGKKPNEHSLIQNISFNSGGGMEFEDWKANWLLRSNKIYFSGSRTSNQRVSLVCNLHLLANSDRRNAHGILYRDYIDQKKSFIIEDKKDTCFKYASVLEQARGCLVKDVCRNTTLHLTHSNYFKSYQNSRYALEVPGFGPYAVRVKEFMAMGNVIFSSKKVSHFETMSGEGIFRRRGWLIRYSETEHLDDNAVALVDKVIEVDRNPDEYIKRAYIMQRWAVNCYSSQEDAPAVGSQLIIETLLRFVHTIKDISKGTAPNPERWAQLSKNGKLIGKSGDCHSKSFPSGLSQRDTNEDLVQRWSAEVFDALIHPTNEKKRKKSQHDPFLWASISPSSSKIVKGWLKKNLQKENRAFRSTVWNSLRVLKRRAKRQNFVEMRHKRRSEKEKEKTQNQKPTRNYPPTTNGTNDESLPSMRF